MELNMNDNVFVKLTESGKYELRKKHEDLYRFSQLSIEYHPKKEDVDGWSKWQLHVLMNTFGHMLNRNSNLPFKPTLKLDVKK